MTINSADRVWDTSTTTGTGSLTLAGSAPTGYKTFSSAFATGTVNIPYCIALQGGSEWEAGWGTLSGSTTLARTIVTASSNSGSAVNFSAGTKDVFVTMHQAAFDQVDDTISDIQTQVNAKLPLTGGTISGALNISSAAPSLKFDDTSSSYKFWNLVDDGIYYVFVDRDNAGLWESPEPLVLDATVNVASTFGSPILTVANVHTLAPRVTIAPTKATTSGTAVDFTGIPATAAIIFINLNGVSFNGADNLRIQLGDSGGIETSGYKTATSATAGIEAAVGGSDKTIHGTVILTKMDSGGEEWMATGGVAVVNAVIAAFAGAVGSKTLSAALDRVRVTGSNGGTFDAGSVSISYI